MRQSVGNLFSKLTGLFFPPRCPVCDGLLAPEDMPETGGGIHARCRRKLVPVKPPLCFCCGKPVESSRTEYCFDCGRRAGKRPFRKGRAMFLYQGAVKQMMYRFKYQNREEYAVFFASYAAENYRDFIREAAPEVIVGVPLHKSRLRVRGYNQAEAFARELAKVTGIVWSKDVIERVRKTRPMKNLDDVSRKNNLKNAFQMKNSVVEYNRILIVDDIYTTGSTIDAVAEALLSDGPKELFFLSICIGEGC